MLLKTLTTFYHFLYHFYHSAGSHKERFGEDGKGKGIAGRADMVDNTGYVGNYKGADTFDKK